MTKEVPTPRELPTTKDGKVDTEKKPNPELEKLSEEVSAMHARYTKIVSDESDNYRRKEFEANILEAKKTVRAILPSR